MDSTTVVVAITGAITTLGVASGGWWFQGKMANQARDEAREARRFETLRDVYANLLRACLAQWTYVSDHATAVVFGQEAPSRDALMSTAQRDAVLADLYSFASPDVIVAAEAFWQICATYETAAATFTMVRSATGPGDDAAKALTAMDTEKRAALAGFQALARRVNTELAAAISAP